MFSLLGFGFVFVISDEGMHIDNELNVDSIFSWLILRKMCGQFNLKDFHCARWNCFTQ